MQAERNLCSRGKNFFLMYCPYILVASDALVLVILMVLFNIILNVIFTKVICL